VRPGKYHIGLSQLKFSEKVNLFTLLTIYAEEAQQAQRKSFKCIEKTRLFSALKNKNVCTLANNGGCLCRLQHRGHPR
jgi:hypothetical protein